MWTGLDVTSTTLLVEPNVLDAMLQGNLLATNIHINRTLFNFWVIKLLIKLIFKNIYF